MRDGVRVAPVRPEWHWKVGMNTQVDCMRAGLAMVPDDAVLFILEDDDVYMPEYMETMLARMGRAELAGERDARYYNVATGRWRVMPGRYHSSMASTVCRGSALVALKNLCSNGTQKMLDVTWWRNFPGNKALLSDHRVVGIKGLPGRPGIGVGHRKNFGSPDDGTVLKKWIGDLAYNYSIFREVA